VEETRYQIERVNVGDLEATERSGAEGICPMRPESPGSQKAPN
jgi:hypothetical protein